MSGPAGSASLTPGGDGGPGAAVKIEDLLGESAWIRSLALKLVRDEATADDLIQETWLAALRRPPRGGLALRPWLAQVLRNAARMRMRSESNRDRREEVVARTEGLPGAAELTARAETQHQLSEAVLALDEPLRETVLLRYYEGLSSAEIARRTGTPAGTVRWRLKRGLEELRERLDERHGDRRTWCVLLIPLARDSAVGSSVAKLALLAALVTVVAGLAVFAPRWGEPRTSEGLAARPDGAPLEREPAPAQTASVAAGERRSPVIGSPESGAVEGAAARAAGAPRVRLRAVDASGRPVSNATLAAAGERASGNAEGRMRLDFASPEAVVELALSAPGFVSRRDTVRAPIRASTELGTWTLAEGGGVAGRVVDEFGRGLPGASVSVEVLPGRWGRLQHQPLEEARYLGTLLERGAEPVPTTATDGQGRFEVGDLPPGFVRVWARAEGRFSAHSEPLPVRAREVVQCPLLHPPAPTSAETLTGRVVDPRGAPVPFAYVEAARRSLNARFFSAEKTVFRARCDARGAFAIHVDPKSRYTLAARGTQGEWEVGLDGPHPAGAVGVVVQLREVRTFELAVSTSERRLESGEFELQLRDRHGRQVEFDRTALPVVTAPHFSFEVRVWARGMPVVSSGFFEAGAAPARVDLALRPGGARPGMRVVVLADGVPVPGASVYPGVRLDPPEVFPRLTLDETPLQRHLLFEGPRVSAADGLVELPPLGEGERFLWIEPPAGLPGYAPTLVRVTPGAVADGSPQRIELSRAGRLVGVAVAPGGRASTTSLAGAIVGITRGDGFFATRRVDADGRFEFEGVAPGSWQVRFLARDSRGAREDSWEELGRGKPPTGAPHFEAEVTAGETAVVELHWSPPAPFVLEGCLSIDGEAPSGWQAQLAPADGGRSGSGKASAALDVSGCFRLETRAPGRYRLDLWNTGYRQLRVNLSDSIELAAQRTPWSVAWQTGGLVVAGAPVGESLVHTWSPDGSLVVETRAEVDAAGRAQFEALPAGPGQLRVEGGAPDAVPVEVQAGSSRSLSLGGD